MRPSRIRPPGRISYGEVVNPHTAGRSVMASFLAERYYPEPSTQEAIAALTESQCAAALEEAAVWLAAHAADFVVVGAPADAADEIAASLVVLSPDARTVLVLSDEGRRQDQRCRRSHRRPGRRFGG